MKFNWFSLVNLIPALVMGIQAIHQNSAGATKKQIVLESLGLATAAADAILPPEQKATADAVSGLIDHFVSLFHSQNAPGFGKNSLKVTGGTATVAYTDNL
jgi:hypothetical protein